MKHKASSNFLVRKHDFWDPHFWRWKKGLFGLLADTPLPDLWVTLIPTYPMTHRIPRLNDSLRLQRSEIKEKKWLVRLWRSILAVTFAVLAGFLAKFLIWRLQQLQQQNKRIVFFPKPSVIEMKNIHDGTVCWMTQFVEWHSCWMAQLLDDTACRMAQLTADSRHGTVGLFIIQWGCIRFGWKSTVQRVWLRGKFIHGFI